MKGLLQKTWKTLKQNPRLCGFKIIRKLGMLNYIEDEKYLKYEFKAVMGYPLNLKNPRTFNEKLQWLKLNDRNPEYTRMVDKFAVKQYVSEKIGQQYIIPTLGVWENSDEIDFDELPDQFVLKPTHSSGGGYICKDKRYLNIKKVKRHMNRAIRQNFYLGDREWPYKNVKPRIIAEKYMTETCQVKLIDYKFYCFYGEPKFLYVSQGLDEHETALISYVTLEWKKAGFRRKDYKEFDDLPPKPSHYNDMLSLAKILSKGITFVRVDFYEINGQIYFSELTFFPGGGFTQIEPSEYANRIGDLIKMPETYK